MSRVEQKKASRPIGIFCFSHIKAGLANKRRLLVAQRAANRYRGVDWSVCEGLAPGAAVAGGYNAGQNLLGDSQDLQNFFVSTSQRNPLLIRFITHHLFY